MDSGFGPDTTIGEHGPFYRDQVRHGTEPELFIIGRERLVGLAVPLRPINRCLTLFLH